MTEDDFLIQLLGSSVGDLTVYGEAARRRKLSSSSSMLPQSSTPSRRELLFTFEYYDPTADPSADVFVAGAVAAAFESALPATLRIVSEGYAPTDYDQIELAVASADIPGLFENNEIADILRGAVLSPVSNIDTHFTAAVSNVSPLFKVSVDAIQRGRDHGLPAYNDVRQVSVLIPFPHTTRLGRRAWEWCCSCGCGQSGLKLCTKIHSQVDSKFQSFDLSVKKTSTAWLVRLPWCISNACMHT